MLRAKNSSLSDGRENQNNNTSQYEEIIWIQTAACVSAVGAQHFIYLHVVCGYFFTPTADLNSYDRNVKAQPKIFTIWLFTENISQFLVYNSDLIIFFLGVMCYLPQPYLWTCK